MSHPGTVALVAGALTLGAVTVTVICWPDLVLKSLRGFWRSFFPPPLKVAAQPPVAQPQPQRPLWRVNFTDRVVEVESAVAYSNATVVTKFTPEQARQYAHNLMVLADSLDKATGQTKVEESK